MPFPGVPEKSTLFNNDDLEAERDSSGTGSGKRIAKTPACASGCAPSLENNNKQQHWKHQASDQTI